MLAALHCSTDAACQRPAFLFVTLQRARPEGGLSLLAVPRLHCPCSILASHAQVLSGCMQGHMQHDRTWQPGSCETALCSKARSISSTLTVQHRQFLRFHA